MKTKSTIPTEEVYKPNYYTNDTSDVIDFCFNFNLDFCTGNVVKYIVRAGKKDNNSRKQDLLKARTYLDRLINNEQ